MVEDVIALVAIFAVNNSKVSPDVGIVGLPAISQNLDTYSVLCCKLSRWMEQLQGDNTSPRLSKSDSSSLRIL